MPTRTKLARHLRQGERVVGVFVTRTVADVYVVSTTITDDGHWAPTSQWPNVTVFWEGGSNSRYPLNGEVDILEEE